MVTLCERQTNIAILAVAAQQITIGSTVLSKTNFIPYQTLFDSEASLYHAISTSRLRYTQVIVCCLYYKAAPQWVHVFTNIWPQQSEQRKWTREDFHIKEPHLPIASSSSQTYGSSKVTSQSRTFLESCFELLKWAPNELCFGLTSFKITSHLFNLWFRFCFNIVPPQN